jgi:membrane protease YdiL (CAAX protease family)
MPLTFNLVPLIVGSVLILLGLVCDVVVLIRFTPVPAFRIQRKPWGLRELLHATAFLFAVVLLANLLYAAVAHFKHSDLETLAPVILPVELVLRVAVLFGFAVFFKYRRITLTSVVGLDSMTARAAVAWGLMFGLASLPAVGAVMLANNGVCRLLGVEPSDQPIAELFVNTDSRFVVAMLTVFAALLAPVFEEFFFRGFAYPALKERLGTARALVIVSLAFAASHLHGPSFVPLFVLALGLGLAYELTGNLLTPVIMHAVFNSTMLVQLFYERTQQ